MDGLITINYDGMQPTVSGRELHTALGIMTRYNDWFARMCGFGFEEEKDYYSILSNRSDGLPGKPRVDHELALSMAKEICMLQRSETGRRFRQYFIEVEEAWNKPELVMARALQLAQKTVEQLIQEKQPYVYRWKRMSSRSASCSLRHGIRIMSSSRRHWFWLRSLPRITE